MHQLHNYSNIQTNLHWYIDPHIKKTIFKTPHKISILWHLLKTSGHNFKSRFIDLSKCLFVYGEVTINK